jgi:peptidoglycan/LPS O-acetylase OafA/YrhL
VSRRNASGFEWRFQLESGRVKKRDVAQKQLFGDGTILDARHHIDELQSLRGVAALMVAISHMSSIYSLPTSMRVAIDCVCNAHACVIVFFVLSGYVLTGSLIRRGPSWSSVKGFYVGRLFRLFPALWLASAISALFLLLYPQLTIHPAPSFWFFLYLHSFPSWTQLILAALAIDRSLIMPVWTIFIELMGSAIMPLVVSIALAKKRLFSWIVLGMGFGAYLLAHAPHRLDSLSYMFDFALGAWLASRKWTFFTGGLPAKICGSVLTLVFFRFVWFAVRNGHPTPLFFGYDDPLPMLVEGIAAVFLVGALASEHGRVALLRSRWAVSLGDVSYSLYLIHFPVAILSAKLLSRMFSDDTSVITATAILMGCSLTISFVLASLIHRFIEIPSIAIGESLSKQIILRRPPVNV